MQIGTNNGPFYCMKTVKRQQRRIKHITVLTLTHGWMRMRVLPQIRHKYSHSVTRCTTKIELTFLILQFASFAHRILESITLNTENQNKLYFKP